MRGKKGILLCSAVLRSAVPFTEKQPRLFFPSLSFSSSDWLPWDKLNQAIFVGKTAAIKGNCIPSPASGISQLCDIFVRVKWGSSGLISCGISMTGLICKIGLWWTNITTARICEKQQKVCTHRCVLTPRHCTSSSCTLSRCWHGPSGQHIRLFWRSVVQPCGSPVLFFSLSLSLPQCEHLTSSLLQISICDCFSPICESTSGVHVKPQ